jgi:cobalt-zinc-cadmium efflux system outer membrane protein
VLRQVWSRLIPLLIFFTNLSYAPEVLAQKAVTLEEAIGMALGNNRDLTAFRKRLEEARGDLTKASLILPSNPKLESQMDNRHSTRENETHTDYTVGLSQEVRIAGQRGKAISVAEKGLEKVKAEIDTLEWTITSRVKGNFYEVLALKKVLELRELIQGLFEKLTKALRTKYDAGAATILEVNSTEIQYVRAKKEYLDARGKYLASLLNLKLLLGLPQDSPIEAKGELKYRKFQTDLSELMEKALKFRPDLKALELEEERASREVSLIKSQRIPNPVLSGFFGRDEGSDRIAGGAISIPLPLIDRKQGELQKANAIRDAARINIEGRTLQIHKELESAYQVFLSSEKGLEVYEEILSELEDSLQLNELTYLEGKTSFVEFLLLQNNLLESKASYLEALLGYYQALVELERASFKSLIE